MEKKQITVTLISFPIEDKQLTSEIKLSDNLIAKFHPLQIDGYDFKLSANIAGHLKGNFGCQAFSLNTVEKLLKFLDGENIVQKGKRVIKIGAKDSNYLKNRILEESESFFIMTDKKVYPKSDYEVREVELTKDNEIHYGDRWGYKQSASKANSESHICISGRRLCQNTTASKNALKKKVEYILEVMTGIRDEYKLLKKEVEKA